MFSFLNRFPIPQWLQTGLFLPIAALNLWLISKAVYFAQPLVSILVLASLLAFLLNYPVQFLEKRGLGRSYAIGAVVLTALSAIAGASITILPLSTQELGELLSGLPNSIQSINQKLQLLQNWATQHRVPIYINQWTDEFANRIPEQVQALGDDALNLLLSALGGVTNLALTGVFTVYLLIDGQQLWNGISRRLPSQKTIQIQRSLQQQFQNYFTGQAIIALLMITVLTLVFLVLKIPFPLLVGLFIGGLSVFPLGSSIASLTSALLVAPDDPKYSFWILGVTIVTNQLMDQLVTPRLMGNLVGLRPFWILLSLLIGVKIGGLVGVLVAVPIASVLRDTLEGFPDAVSSYEDSPVVKSLARPLNE